MIKMNVLRKCGHLECVALSMGCTVLQVETQRIVQQEKICLECLTKRCAVDIEKHKTALIKENEY